MAQAAATSAVGQGRGIGFGLLRQLAGRPLWLTGMAMEIAGFVLEATAFALAAATLVAPVLAWDVPGFVLLSALLARRALPRRAVLAAAATGVGVAGLGVSFGASSGVGSLASSGQLLGLLAVAAAGAGAAALLTRPGRRFSSAARQAVVLSGAAGLCYACATLATRQVGRVAAEGRLLGLLTSPTPYVLVGCSVLAIPLLQRGLQLRPVVAYPVSSAMSAVLPVAGSVVLFSEPVPHGWSGVLFVGCVAVIVAGVAALARLRPDAESSAPRPRAPAAVRRSP